MKYQRRGDFVGSFDALREQYDYWHEVKWNKANSKKAKPLHFDLIDYFFARQWLTFRCLIVDKSIVDKRYHKGNYELARQKHYTMFLRRIMKDLATANPSREIEFRVHLDNLNFSYQKAHEAMEIISNHDLKRMIQVKCPVASVMCKDSKESEGIQLCDLMLGATMEAWQQNADSETKKQLQTHMANHLDWTDLRADTWPSEKKFNIWHFHPDNSSARVRTRKVNLK